MMRVGIGYDIHRYGDGRAVTLGGVAIPHYCSLVGHSDADVLLHAIMDALLGAAGLPDIGHHFPNTDPAYRGIRSTELLQRVAGMISEAGFAVGNIDATVLAEQPKIGPHILAMRERIARCVDIDVSAVGVKATTNERLGAVGRDEGIAAMAVALLIERGAS